MCVDQLARQQQAMMLLVTFKTKVTQACGEQGLMHDVKTMLRGASTQEVLCCPVYLTKYTLCTWHNQDMINLQNTHNENTYTLPEY